MGKNIERRDLHAQTKEVIRESESSLRERAGVNVNETFTLSPLSLNSLLPERIRERSVCASDVAGDEGVRIPVSFRVRDSVYMLYKRLDKREKRLVRALLEVIIKQVASGAFEVRAEDKNVIINMPVSLSVSMSGSSPSSSPEHDEVLLKRVRRLEKKLREYRKELEEYEEEVKRLNTLLKEREQRLRELEARLKEVDINTLKSKAEAEVVKKLKSTLWNLVRKNIITKFQLAIIFREMGWQ